MSERKRVSRAQRERIYLNSGGKCQKCGDAIDIDLFHVAHLRSHANGGPAVDENLEAWCLPCNWAQGSADVRDTRAVPRGWQQDALATIVKRITNDQVATLSAAPGAGKTIFSGLTFQMLRDNDVVDRMVVMVPRRNLVEQWVAELQSACHIDLKGNATVHRPSQHGVVVTYQSLTAYSINNHQAMAADSRTLLVLDEVHHVGEKMHTESAAWARNVKAVAGEVDNNVNVAGVLNLSGTLWRSNDRERISTVRYIDLGGHRIQAIADAEKTAKELIQEYHLRPIDLFRLGARVEISELAAESVTESNIIDLDKEQGKAVLRNLPKSAEFRQAFVSSVLDQLELRHRAFSYPFKGLIVASTQADARAFRDEVDRQMSARGLRPLAELAVSDEPDAAQVLKDFRTRKQVGVLCTVGMAGEGYDCKDIAVVGYASNKTTKQYIYQVIARAQRVTKRELAEKKVLPAAVVIPDVQELVDLMVNYLAEFNPPVNSEATAPADPDSERDGEGGMSWYRFGVENVQVTEENVTISDGEGGILFHGNREITDLLGQELEKVHLRAVDAPRFAAVLESLGAQRPFDVPDPAGAYEESKQRRMGVEEQCKTFQGRLRTLEGWWHHNGDTPVELFVTAVNDAAGIPVGGREQAEASQLGVAVDYAANMIADLCRKTGKRLPKVMQKGA